tara:strand:- start:118 stop:1023 length:906 start_codon:yes stop_codon:yes gene_type:complete
MLVKLLHTDGKGKFLERTWTKPTMKSDEIEVKATMTGVCRSDIDMMHGNFGPLPLHMQGHEGLGQVTKVGADIKGGIKVGDYVATRGEPAYADYYNVRDTEFVVVPENDPKYIVEPVACGINIVMTILNELVKRKKSKILIIGSGFLSTVVYAKLKALKLDDFVDILGSSNRKFWEDRLITEPRGKYDVVIDLKAESTLLFDFSYLLEDNPVIVMAAEKKGITTTFGNFLWKNATMVFPSPRNPNFYFCMQDAVNMIKTGMLNVDTFWTKAYDRETEWQQAFEDGSNRPEGYSRGYIKWNK